ncbi:MAG: Transcriptional regulator, LysR family [Hydrocarboniphaga sp.]|nr:Transcriptional regulator, LysR family [Hydrocarboniphaga sp.]
MLGAMSLRLPPLQALQAFEAAARHQSYTRAAEELALTHGAISYQISALEDRVGTKLFRRERNRMLMTDAGRLLLANVRQGLMLLERAFDTRVPTERRVSLTLSTLPSLARCWLVPRLLDFQCAHPDIDLLVDPSGALVDLEHDGVDIAIRYGGGGWSGVQQQLLMDEELFPVCSPRYRGGHLPQTPADLADCHLMHNPWQPWEPWFHAAGLSLRETARGVSYTDSALLLDAAAAGQGIVLARRALAWRDLAEGRLVRLFEVSIPDTSRYYLLWRHDHPRLADVLRLRDWLLAQATAADPPLASVSLFLPGAPAT